MTYTMRARCKSSKSYRNSIRIPEVYQEYSYICMWNTYIYTIRQNWSGCIRVRSFLISFTHMDIYSSLESFSIYKQIPRKEKVLKIKTKKR